MFCVYVLKCHNCSKKIKHKYLFYTGYSKKLRIRLEEHLKQRVKSTKRYRGKVELVYFEVYFNKRDAMIREKEIKKLSREKKEELIDLKYKVFCNKCKGLMLPKHLQNHGYIYQCDLCKFCREVKIDWSYFSNFKNFRFILSYDNDNKEKL
jgi:putative endonuclease